MNCYPKKMAKGGPVRHQCEKCGAEVDSDGVALLLLEEAPEMEYSEDDSSEMESPEKEAPEEQEEGKRPRGRAFAKAFAAKQSNTLKGSK